MFLEVPLIRKIIKNQRILIPIIQPFMRMRAYSCLLFLLVQVPLSVFSQKQALKFGQLTDLLHAVVVDAVVVKRQQAEVLQFH